MFLSNVARENPVMDRKADIYLNALHGRSSGNLTNYQKNV